MKEIYQEAIKINKDTFIEGVKKDTKSDIIFDGKLQDGKDKITP